MQNIDELIDLLNLEKIEENIFRGQNYQAPWNRVFGGQVLAQSLYAAYQTVPEDRFVHSLHGYFILTGDISKPIIYHVDRIRDGGSFTTRRIVAIQHGRAIFNMSASFQLIQESFDHQIPMPKVLPPEESVSEEKIANTFKEEAPEIYRRLTRSRPIEFRRADNFRPLEAKNISPFQHVWFKGKGTLPKDKRLHQTALAYASDYNLLGTALLPHREQIDINKIFLASLDHAMWFHRDFDMNDWLLYAIDSPSASNSRGFTSGKIFNQQGVLVASVAQEGLIRTMNK
ncbi:acyl-CoA thioesterase II [Fulvivirgaceae bacterium BMA12]|uniref:Acyl-CoA thioesterase II n=1 Tax=Agaribacillus aureus TaxID=3051825 RepID=A0ABT8LHY8_9BACT|nr:acyl-CoA thioesterase II [Fulvivirgaceae bacterium BMA12]